MSSSSAVSSRHASNTQAATSSSSSFATATTRRNTTTTTSAAVEASATMTDSVSPPDSVAPNTAVAASTTTTTTTTGASTTASSSQQPKQQSNPKRFSFYNAQDYHERSPKVVAQVSPRVRQPPHQPNLQAGGGGGGGGSSTGTCSPLSASSKAGAATTTQAPLRFNFYNAQEVQAAAVVGKSASPVAEPISALQKNSTSNRTRSATLSPNAVVRGAVSASASATTATAIARGAKLAATEHTQRNRSTVTVAATEDSTTNLDSSEILKSLQEHEQQRLEILGATPRRRQEAPPIVHPYYKPSSRAPAATATTATTTTTTSGAPPTALTTANQTTDTTTTNTHTYTKSAATGSTPIQSAAATASSSNPYEDAIKEALDLLRKHRSTSSSSNIPQDLHFASRSLVPPPAPAGGSTAAATHTFFPNESTQLAATSSAMDPSSASLDDLTRQVQEWNPAALSSVDPLTAAAATTTTGSYWDEALVAAARSSSSANNSNSSADAMHTPRSVASGSSLGEAYQAEIEARRRQRQERMARYASRLAELKQEDATDLSSAAGHGATAETGSHTTHPLPSHTMATLPPERKASPCSLGDGDGGAGAVAMATAAWDEANHAAPVPKSQQTVDASLQLAPSNNSQNSQEDEVQRGVERVLMAILQRAHHSTNTTSSTAAASMSWQLGEEKKSSQLTEDRDVAAAHALVTGNSSAYRSQLEEDALVRAMSDLLGSSSRESPKPSLGASHSQEDSTARPAALEVPTLSRPPTSAGGWKNAPRTALGSSGEDQRSTQSETMESTRTDNVFAAAGLAAVRSDPGSLSDVQPSSNRTRRSVEDDALDEMVQRVFRERNRKTSSSHPQQEPVGKHGGDESHEPPPTPSSGNARMGFPNPSTDALIASSPTTSVESSERVRRILSHVEDSEDDEGRDDEYEDDDDYDEDESLANTSLDIMATDESEDDDGPNADSHTLDGVLGPLSKKAGGTTGVVLEADDPPVPRHAASQSPVLSQKLSSPSILESLSAAIDMVTGAKSSDETRSSKQVTDKYSSEFLDDDDDDDEEDEDDEDETADEDEETADEEEETAEDESDSDSEATDLMLTLCAHMLPKGVVSQSGRLLDEAPFWDEDNPDEPGYRIVRLTRAQLRRIEREYERLLLNLKKKEKRRLRVDTEDTFERDLQEAEEMLDQAEKQTGVPVGRVGLQKMHSPMKGVPAQHLPSFPGIKAVGQGEMGDLEFYYLPVIFKSHVTGFEPTKDLFLEAGNVVAGQYLVQGEIGSAAFSTAYRCVDLSSDADGPEGHEEVCLKVIKNTKDFFDQSLDEIKILELLRQTGQCHQHHILEMKTFFYHREHLIIVTELLRQNLFEFGKFIIDNNEEPYFTLPRLGFITRQCLIALDFTHRIGLVHSDVKPENILLGSYSRALVKLIDFGSSCFLTDRQSSYIQSRSYRAPEVVLGLPYDGRIDIWSLGCVVAEMFTGEVTFQNDSIVSMLSRIEAICGRFPEHMVTQGRQSGRYFTNCGLLYERVDEKGEAKDTHGDYSSDEDGNSASCIDIFQPKRTNLPSRLGIKPDIVRRYNAGLPLSEDELRQAEFVDFVRSLLTIDPEKRLTAGQALQHPWIQYAATLTEEDIKYPSS